MISLLSLSVAMATPDATWLAPDEVSHVEGPYGVMFQPRYGHVSTAHTEAARDIARLAEARKSMDEATRAEATLRVRDRLRAVQTWQSTFVDSIDDLDEQLLSRPALTEAWFLLSAEESTLQLQLQLMGEPEATATPLTAAMALGDGGPPDDHEDLVAFGESIVVGPNMTVRDAISFGGDVLIEGRVLSDAVAFGGDVHIRPSAVVLGDAVSFGGTVQMDDTAHVGRRHLSFQSPADAFASQTMSAKKTTSPWSRLRGMAVSWLALAGAGLLTLGLFPTQVDGVASTISRRPVASTLIGFTGSLAAVLGSLLFAITLIGLPVSLLLLSALGLGGLMGFVAICQVVGDRLPMRQTQHGRWLAFLVATVGLTIISMLPAIGAMAVCGVLFSGVGATVLSRYGG